MAKPQTGRFYNLPQELLILITEFVLAHGYFEQLKPRATELQFVKDDEDSPSDDDRLRDYLQSLNKHTNSLKSLSRTCHKLRRIVLPYIYQHTRLSEINCIPAFRKLRSRYEHRLPLIRKLDLQPPDQEYDVEPPSYPKLFGMNRLTGLREMRLTFESPPRFLNLLPVSGDLFPSLEKCIITTHDCEDETHAIQFLPFLQIWTAPRLRQLTLEDCRIALPPKDWKPPSNRKSLAPLKQFDVEGYRFPPGLMRHLRNARPVQEIVLEEDPRHRNDEVLCVLGKDATSLRYSLSDIPTAPFWLPDLRGLDQTSSVCIDVLILFGLIGKDGEEALMDTHGHLYRADKINHIQLPPKLTELIVTIDTGSVTKRVLETLLTVLVERSNELIPRLQTLKLSFMAAACRCVSRSRHPIDFKAVRNWQSLTGKFRDEQPRRYPNLKGDKWLQRMHQSALTLVSYLENLENRCTSAGVILQVSACDEWPTHLAHGWD